MMFLDSAKQKLYHIIEHVYKRYIMEKQLIFCNTTFMGTFSHCIGGFSMQARVYCSCE